MTERDSSSAYGTIMTTNIDNESCLAVALKIVVHPREGKKRNYDEPFSHGKPFSQPLFDLGLSSLLCEGCLSCPSLIGVFSPEDRPRDCKFEVPSKLIFVNQRAPGDYWQKTSLAGDYISADGICRCTNKWLETNGITNTDATKIAAYTYRDTIYGLLNLRFHYGLSLSSEIDKVKFFKDLVLGIVDFMRKIHLNRVVTDIVTPVSELSMEDKGTHARLCANCHKTGKMHKCLKCKDAYYCSRVCQERDWPFHRHTCNKPDARTLKNPIWRRAIQAVFEEVRDKIFCFHCSALASRVESYGGSENKLYCSRCNDLVKSFHGVKGKGGKVFDQAGAAVERRKLFEEKLELAKIVFEEACKVMKDKSELDTASVDQEDEPAGLLLHPCFFKDCTNMTNRRCVCKKVFFCCDRCSELASEDHGEYCRQACQINLDTAFQALSISDDGGDGTSSGAAYTPGLGLR
jgi:hypothetical protein